MKLIHPLQYAEQRIPKEKKKEKKYVSLFFVRVRM